jgi:hypothetical protein
MDPLFKAYVEQLWESYKYKEDQPWEGLRQLKKVFMEAAKLLRLDRSRDKTSVEFQLTVCSKFFKAVRANEPTAVQEIVRDYNRLSGCYASRASGLHLTQRFFNLWQELSANEADKAMQAEKPKNSLSKTIAIHNVASPSSLDAIWDNATNKPVRDRAARVKLLDAHWEKVFEPKSCDSASFDEFVEGYHSTFPSIAWELDAEYLDELLNKPRKSAPSPDGIPFSAYSSAKHISKKVLWMCALDIRRGGSPPPDFNFASLTLLAKKPSHEVDGVKWYLPKSTRPISVVNTDNRIIANLYRQVLSRFADKMCRSEQQGFLSNRWLLQNVVDVDMEARKLYVKDGKGGMFLVDLSAAFPSLGHEYLFKVLARQGVPDDFLNALRMFYVENQHFTSLDGESSKSFKVHSGVRQGCPMSPVLFALALDPFLDYLCRKLPPTDMVRAYADDTCIVVQDVHTLPVISKCFT